MDEFSLEPYHRRSIRLKGYDYTSPGGYFITLVAYQRECLFGNIIDSKMEINAYGMVVSSFWRELTNHFVNIMLDSFIVMPNHIHGIIFIKYPNTGLVDNTRAGLRPAPTEKHSLSEIIRSFKSFSAKEINKSRGMNSVPVWQRNYYEHIIRNNKELNDIRQCIVANIINWDKDIENTLT